MTVITPRQPLYFSSNKGATSEVRGYSYMRLGGGAGGKEEGRGEELEGGKA